MQMWSQRRIIAPFLLGLGVLLPTLARSCGWVAGGKIVPRAVGIPVVLCLLLSVGAHCIRQWPAAYTVQYEKGAQAWIESVRKRIGTRFALVDDFRTSVPLSVDGLTRVVGLNEVDRLAHPPHVFRGLPLLAAWARQRVALTNDLVWITRYRNPGLESGVRLEEEGKTWSLGLARLAAKYALPAQRSTYEARVSFLSITPVKDSDRPRLSKVLDGGPLALRGPWGRMDIRLKDSAGERVPAGWTRQGSQVLGPVPRDGEVVKISIIAGAAQRRPNGTQVLSIQPPWDGAGLVFPVSNVLTRVVGQLVPAAGFEPTERIGVYTLTTSESYDPSRDGISGFQSDLGVLLHSIAITLHDVVPGDDGSVQR